MMTSSRWHVRTTAAELPKPRSSPTADTLTHTDDWAYWLKKTRQTPGTPFLLSPAFDYDTDLNDFFRTTAMVTLATTTQIGYARDLASFLTFVNHIDHERDWRGIEDSDHLSYRHIPSSSRARGMMMAMEPTPRLMHGTNLTMVMDHSQFYVHGGGADSVFELVEAALQGEKWASNGRSIVVITPVEYNFNMLVRVEVWDGPPPTDLADWTMHHTTELEVSSNTLQLESTSGEPRATAVPNGHYLIEIAGRNFPSSLSADQSEQWRIRMWPNQSDKPENDRSAAGEVHDPADEPDILQAESPPPPSPQLHLRNSARQP